MVSDYVGLPCKYRPWGYSRAKIFNADHMEMALGSKVLMVELSMTFTACAKCDKPARTSGLCPRHYSQALTGSEERLADVSDMPKCSVWHCESDANSRAEGSYCQTHYNLNYRGVDPVSRVIRKDPTPKHMHDLKCAVAECPRRAAIRGCCKAHHKGISMGRIEAPEGVDIPLNPMCSFPDCINRQESKKQGLCHSHICQILEGRELSPLRQYAVYHEGQLACSIQSCKRLAISRTMCQQHLARAGKYGLNAQELDDILSVGKCQNPACSETKNLHIDHDHQTGQVRGVLCSSCNTTLGHMKEDVERIRGLAEYKLMHS